MIKKSLLFLLLCFTLFGVTRAEEEVMIGDATSTTTEYYLPVNMFYNYSLTQQIYTAEEIGMAGTINSIAFDYAYTNSFTMNNVQVYMMNVDKSSFESTTDMVSLANAELVWEGTFTASGAGWVTLELDTPFVYDGTSNLLVCCYDPTNGYSGVSFTFRTTATTDYLAMAYYSDTYTPSLTDVSAFAGSKGRYQYRANIMIDITPSGSAVCSKPNSIEVTNVTAYGATVTWTSGSYFYNFQYKKATDEEWIQDYSMTYMIDTEYDLYLQPGTTYDVRVQSICFDNGTGDPYTSGWKSTRFTTDCGAITSFPWTENFDSYTGGGSDFLPLCWQRINTGTGSSSYNTYPHVSSIGSHSSPNFLLFYTYGSSSYTHLSDQYAILPEMENLAGKQISFFAKGYNNQSAFKIGTITDPTDVTTFTVIATQALTTTFQEFTYYVPANTEDNYIAIMMEKPNTSSDVDRGVYIDDITIDFPPACPKPTALTVTNVTGHTAQLSWTSNADAWQIHLIEDDEFIDVTTNPYSLEGLFEETTYTIEVRANCGNDGYSEWSDAVSFTTPLACPAPTGLAISDITGHTATLNWTGESDSYIVSYRTSRTASDNSIFEDFDSSSLPSGWEIYTGLLENVMDGSVPLTATNYGWYFGNYNGVFDSHAKLNIYGTSCNYWLVSPEIEVETPNLPFSFDLALTRYYGTLQPIDNTLQQDDKFAVLVSTDNAETWTIIRQWDNESSNYVYNNIACSATGQYVSMRLRGYNTQQIRIAFYGESTNPTGMTNTGGDNNLHIDNVLLGYANNAGEWQTVTVTGNTCTLTGLDPETKYDVKVESVCSGEQGHETNTIKFTTDVACPAPFGFAITPGNYNATVEVYGTSDSYIVSYRATVCTEHADEDFNTSTIPSGWTRGTGYVNSIVNGSTTLQETTSGWHTSTSVLDSYHMELDVSGINCMDWLVTPETELGGDLSFDLAITNQWGETPNIEWQLDDRFVVLIYADNAWTILREWNNTGSNYSYNSVMTDVDGEGNTVGQHFTIDLSAYYGKNVKFAFYGESTMNDPLPYYSEASVHLDNVSWGIANTWQTVTVGDTTATLTGLTPETVYEAKVQGNCGEDGLSLESDVFTFTTLIACPIPTDVEVSNITYNKATVAWTGYSDSYEVSYRTAAGEEAPFKQNFENELLGWTFTSMNAINDIGGTGANTAGIYPNAAHSGSYGFRFSSYSTKETDESYDQYLVSPKLTVTGELKFYFKKHSNSYAEQLYVGYSTTTNDLDAFTWTADLAPTITWQEYTQALPADVKYIALHYFGNCTYYVYVDDITIGAYEVLAGEWETVEAAESPVILTGLTFVTDYEVKVKGFCDGEPTEETEIVTFTTPVMTGVTQTIEIPNTGSSSFWFSTYIEMEPVELLEAIEDALGEDGIEIKYKNNATAWDEEEEEWSGGLQNIGLTNDKTYMIKTSAAVTVTLEGPASNPADYTINLAPKAWTWIGFPCGVEVDIENAFADFEPIGGDQIKAKNAVSSWDDDEEEWSGGVTKLVPGTGYMFYSAGTTTRTLSFSTGSTKTQNAKK